MIQPGAGYAMKPYNDIPATGKNTHCARLLGIANGESVMRVRMTYDLDKETLEAVGVVCCGNRKRTARRGQVIQFLAELVTERLGTAKRELRRRKANPDPHQMKIPGIGSATEA